MAQEETAKIAKTVKRAFAILRAFTNGGQSLSVSDVARRTGLHISTSSRLLATLEHLEVISRDPQTENFWFGPEIKRYASELPFRDYLTALAYPFLSELAELTQETVNFCLPEDGQVVHVAQVASDSHLIGRKNWVGFANPLHVASNGKVMMAYWPESDIERYLAQPLKKVTEFSITDPSTLRTEFAVIREQGYALGIEELEIGLVGISAPVFVRGELVVAAVNVSGPTYRLDGDKIALFSQLTTDAARKITHKLQRKV